MRFIRAKVGSRNLYRDRVGAKNKWVFLPVRDDGNGPDQDFVMYPRPPTKCQVCPVPRGVGVPEFEAARGWG